jgi:phospholipid transport system substrate-binding protein
MMAASSRLMIIDADRRFSRCVRIAIRWAAGRLIMCAVIFGFTPVAGASEITEPIEQLDAGLLQAMKAGKAAPFQQRYDILAPLVIRAFDLDFILQSAAGTAWQSLPADQQAALKTAFQRYSIATYVANFDDFSGERFDLSPPVDGKDTVVQVRIVPGPSGGDVHTLGYVMQQTVGKWKAVDVVADGFISQGTVQKAEIRAVLALNGTAGLLARLRQKVVEISGEALR